MNLDIARQIIDNGLKTRQAEEAWNWVYKEINDYADAHVQGLNCIVERLRMIEDRLNHQVNTKIYREELEMIQADVIILTQDAEDARYARNGADRLCKNKELHTSQYDPETD